jgi:RecA-family ATPase
MGDEEPSDDDAEDWILRDLIPRGEPWLFGGPWKCGKTWTAIAMTICVALGIDFLGCENTLRRPGRVLLIPLEDGRRRMRKRVWQVLRGMGLTPSDPRIQEHLRIGDNPIRIPGDPKAIKRFIAEMQRWKPDVIVIDSLSRVMTGSQNDIKDASAFTAAWREITIGTGAAPGFLHHTNKGSEDPQNPRDLFDKMRGSGELLAAPRNLIVMERLTAGDTKLSAVSMRGNLDLRRESFALEWTQDTTVDGKTAITLYDRGDVGEIRREIAAAHKAEKKTANDAKKQEKTDNITRTALLIARDRGACSAPTLAVVLAVADRTAANYLADLRKRNLLGAVGADGCPITTDGIAWLSERGVH